MRIEKRDRKQKMVLVTSSTKKLPLRSWKNPWERCDRSLPGELLLPRCSRSQPLIVRGIFFVEQRAISRSVSLEGTIDDNHQHYPCIRARARSYITQRDMHECEDTQVVRYKATASCYFYSLDTQHTHIQIRAYWK